MTNAWEYFKNFFREAEQSSASRPIFNEILERSPAEQLDQQAWIGSLPCRRLLGLLAEQYAISASNPASVDASLTFLQTPSTNGFAIHFDRLDFGKNDASNFFDLLKEKVLALNYRSSHSDNRSWSEGDWIKTVQRYYLKPRQDWASEVRKIDQRFGNITIELNHRNDQPYLLTFRATSYSDHLYAPPSDFHELMQALLA